MQNVVYESPRESMRSLLHAGDERHRSAKIINAIPQNTKLASKANAHGLLWPEAME
jgi:hypothetical protein